MSAVLRRGRVLAAVSAVVALLLAGCASGPSQVGAAAIVGGSSIAVVDVQQRLDTVLRKEPEAKKLQEQRQLDDISRLIVSNMVTHKLLEQGAQREGVSVNEEQVTRLVNDAGGAEEASKGTIFDANTFRDRARAQLLSVELGRKYIDKLSITFDYTQAPSRQTALEKARQMAQGPAKAVVEQDARNGTPAALNQRLTAAENPQLAATALFGAKPNTVVVLQPNVSGQSEGQTQWLVALIRERRTDDAGSGQNSGADQVDPRYLEYIGQRMLQPMVEEIGVKISPRYGVWDDVAFKVATSSDETQGVLLPVRSASK